MTKEVKLDNIDRAIKYLEVLATDLTGESCKYGLSWGDIDWIERRIEYCDLAIEALEFYKENKK